MTPKDIVMSVDIISAAMNVDEGRWAKETFNFYFNCQQHGMNSGREYYVFKDDDKLIGLVGLHHYVWGPAENIWLSWFAVSPDYQRQGVGSAMLEAIMKIGRKKGFTKLFIETYDGPDFEKARRFYTAMGFTEAGRIDDYLPNHASMRVFRKDL